MFSRGNQKENRDSWISFLNQNIYRKNKKLVEKKEMKIFIIKFKKKSKKSL